MITSIWFQLVLVIVSACQLTETFRHGSIFSRLRAWLENRGPFWEGLVTCGFCFSHWAAAIAILLFLLHNLMLAKGYILNPFFLILLWLTAIRGANLLNDLTKKWSRSPSSDRIPAIEIDMDDKSED